MYIRYRARTNPRLASFFPASFLTTGSCVLLFAPASALAAVRPRAEPSALEAGAISAGNSRIPRFARFTAESLSGLCDRAPSAQRLNVNDSGRTVRALVVAL